METPYHPMKGRAQTAIPNCVRCPHTQTGLSSANRLAFARAALTSDLTGEELTSDPTGEELSSDPSGEE
ncbi:hypothetical protein ACOMHN_041311 [Nucella lapillus]